MNEDRMLFIKYMYYVGECEGIYCIPHESNSFFTPEEIQTLNTIAYEADALDEKVNHG